MFTFFQFREYRRTCQKKEITHTIEQEASLDINESEVVDIKEVIVELTKIEPKKEEKQITIVEEKIIKKEYVLYRTSDENRKYDIVLKSTIKDTSNSDKTKYISISGVINNSNKKYYFLLPYNENYQEFSNELKLEFTNQKTKVKSICDGYFLDSLTPELSYFVNVEISEDYADCYIVSQSDFKENQNKLLNNENYENVTNNFKGKKIDLLIDFSNKESLKNIKLTDVGTN